MIRVFGLTGGVASGKSTVAARFAERGIPVINADLLARQIVAPGSPALIEIVKEFGEEMLLASGELNRKHLAARIFADPEARLRLNAITHPRVAAAFQEEKQKLEERGIALACYDVPLLFERGLQATLRPVVVVSVAPDLQEARLMTRDSLSRPEARARIAAQLPLEEKVRQADYVIDNSGSNEETRATADRVLDAIRASLGVTARKI
jgi:dephospho-CoA kinase